MVDKNIYMYFGKENEILLNLWTGGNSSQYLFVACDSLKF